MPEGVSKTLLVLAAGIGRRFGGLKQLEAVGPGGETLLEYSIFDALRSGFGRVVLVIRPETAEEFATALEKPVHRGVSISYVYQRLTDVPSGIEPPTERIKPWGTGQAVLAAESEIDGPFAVINADDFYGAGAYTAIHDFLSIKHPGPILTFALAGFSVGRTLTDNGPVTRGLCRVDRENWLKRVFEIHTLARNGADATYTDPTGAEQVVAADTIVSMNMWAFSRGVFAEFGKRFHRFLETEAERSTEFLLPDIIQAMIADGTARVRVIPHDGVWCGITFREDLEPVRRFIARLVERGVYPARLWE